MKNNKLKKVLIILIIVTILLRLSFIVININHDCNHDHCPICNIINNFNNDLKTFIPNINNLLIISFSYLILNRINYKKNNLIKTNTLTNLKVRLNN